MNDLIVLLLCGACLAFCFWLVARTRLTYLKLYRNSKPIYIEVGTIQQVNLENMAFGTFLVDGISWKKDERGFEVKMTLTNDAGIRRIIDA